MTSQSDRTTSQTSGTSQKAAQSANASVAASASSGPSPTPDQIRRAPKVLLHDHLDGGLRPGTIVDLARDTGYTQLPQTDPDKLGAWFRDAADSGSLEGYL